MSDQLSSPKKSSMELNQQAYNQYLLYSRSEILFILRQIMQKKCMLTVYFDGGRAFFLTTLVALSDDGSWLYFEPGSDTEMNLRALKSEKFMLTTMLDKVKVQFSLGGLHEVPAGSRTAFAASVPETLLRLQRREHFRLSAPIARPLHCRFALPIGDQRTRRPIDAVLLDISGGGVGLQLDPGLEQDVPIGKQINDCTISLGEEGDVSVNLAIRNAFRVTNKAGTPYLRVGAEYVDLSGATLTAIQRYITQMERDRKARESGLA